MQLQISTIVRNRGQLTIPGSIRHRVSWITPGSVVTVAQVGSDEIVIKPHVAGKNKVDWNKLWRNIELARSHKGTYSGSLSKFIMTDRENRR